MQERCAICSVVQEVAEWQEPEEPRRTGTFICDRCSQRIQNEARETQKR